MISVLFGRYSFLSLFSYSLSSRKRAVLSYRRVNKLQKLLSMSESEKNIQERHVSHDAVEIRNCFEEYDFSC